jgi:hypothetical protein
MHNCKESLAVLLVFCSEHLPATAMLIMVNSYRKVLIGGIYVDVLLTLILILMPTILIYG